MFESYYLTKVSNR